MSIYESPAAIEERVVNEIVARHQLPNDVEGIAVEFGFDHSDAPAVWLAFTLRIDVEETQSTYHSIYGFADSVRLELRDAGIERFAHVRVKRPAPNAQNYVST